MARAKQIDGEWEDCARRLAEETAGLLSYA